MNAKILIADDESDIVSMLGSFFESKGFRGLPASNEMCIRDRFHASRKSFDFVLTFL